MKILFFDCESTDLAASWGRILCTSFATLTGKPYTFHIGQKKYQGKDEIDDSKLVEAVRDELNKADMIVGWNSILFDVPLLNSRLALAGKAAVHPYKHFDMMWYAAGSSNRIGSRKLDNSAKFFNTPNQKTPLAGPVWQRASAGNRAALKLVIEHCEADVLTTRDLFPHYAPFVKKFVLPMSAWWKFADQIEVER